MSLRDFIDNARTSTTTRRRTEWTEVDYQTALDMRLTGYQASELLGCSAQTVWNERGEWLFE